MTGSGNKRSSTVIYFPSCISSVISVGSTDTGADETTADEVSVFSNSSPLLDLLAPGRGIATSVPGEGFGRFNGTSFSVPHVAGAWAVLKSKAPNASVPDLLSALKSTGGPVLDPRNQLIKPRIQVDAALDKIVRELPYSTGTRLTLTGRPNPGFRFRSWQGCDSPSGNRCVVEMDSTRQVVALFEPTTAAHPDLIPTSLVAPPIAETGRPVSIYAAVSNPGPVDAGPFRIGFYLSVDDTVTTDDTWFAACSFDSGLPAGESGTCNRLFPLPPRVSAGRYFLGAIVDDLDQVAESSETNNVRAGDGGPLEVSAPPPGARSFVPVVLSAAGLRNSFFTSELTLTNRGAQETRLEFIYQAHRGGGSGLASDVIPPGRQMILPDALDYLLRQGLSVPPTGNRIGTLEVRLPDSSSKIGVLVRTATEVPEGRAGLAYPGIEGDRGFREAVYLCGLRQNARDRSNLAFQNMGTTADGTITLKTTVFSGDPGDDTVRDLGTMELGPGEFHQFSPVLATVANGYVRVEPVDGKAPFYAYGVINDQANSDGSFVFPVAAGSLEGSLRHTLPVIVEVNEFSSELTVTNFSQETKTLDFSFVAEGLTTPDDTARFSLRLEPGRQRIVPDVIHTEMRRKGVEGVPAGKGGLAGALFATVKSGDMNGIVIGARTSSSDGRGGQYGVFYNAVPDGAAFGGSAWIDALQQNEENRSNLALVNTGEVDDSPSLFEIDIYDGETGMRVRTVTTDKVRPEDAKGIRLPARRWHQINGILSKYAQGTTQGYVRVRRISGNNPFLAYGVVNDGGAPGQRSGDGSYLPARQ
ncbi:MAG: S8 family serine peptidase [Acidobacteria bacterium]|nr:S8 family serine peptidase [Acidobacteriota bacterium]